ncbi:unnamed protein product [Periconia digitata]|uniref:Uncharacterized protein n=1 Tax=Periconia digitata TaxID=1303443 RepID=A0A9W4U5Q2_9PLEO|nr:unnamed protein product [Periconia digitata]
MILCGISCNTNPPRIWPSTHSSCLLTHPYEEPSRALKYGYTCAVSMSLTSYPLKDATRTLLVKRLVAKVPAI